MQKHTNDDERSVASELQRDAEVLYRTAALPTAYQVLWQAKVRTARQRRDRIAQIVTYLVCGAVAVPAVALSAIAWNAVTTVTSAPPMIVGVVGVAILMALVILAAVPLAHRLSPPPLRRRA